jgi:membrane protein implicated in regulation of membrane protease activity
VIIFATLTLAAFILGIVFILQHGTLASLGGPLIVGALFSASAFVSQFWAVDFQRYLEVRNFVYRKKWDYLKKLAEREAELNARIDELESRTDKIHPDSKSGESEES